MARKLLILLFPILLIFASLSFAEDEEKPRIDYQKIADEMRWRFDNEKTDFISCFLSYYGEYNIALARIEKELRVRIMLREYTMVDHVVDGSTVFAIKDELAVFAHSKWKLLTLFCYEIKGEQLLWSKELGLPDGVKPRTSRGWPRFHRVNLGFHGDNDALVVYAKTFPGRYVRFFDTKAGELLATRVFDSKLRCSAEDLRSTRIIPDLNWGINKDTNLVYCATFQLAWNRLCELNGISIDFEGYPVSGPGSLNKQEVTAEDVDEESILIGAGRATSNTVDGFKEEIERKFGETARPRFLERISDLRDDAIAVYCYLKKALGFTKRFEKHDFPLMFDGEYLPCFGIQKYSHKLKELGPQVLIHSRKSNNDFVIELVTDSPGDQLILAKVKPGRWLKDTIERVNGRLLNDDVPQIADEVPLSIPFISFDIDRYYEEFVDATIKSGNFVGLPIIEAIQNIRFELNEGGVKLRSEATYAVAGIPDPEPPEYIFDKPFLLMLKRRGREMPYFALWVDNAEILVKE